MKNIKGFTLMEVVIVIAVIAILSAVLIPSFTGYTERARLRSDIQSARTVQNAIDLYRAEVGKDAGTDAGTEAKSADINAIIAYLAGKDYLAGSPVLQTEDAQWNYDSTSKKIRVNIGKSPASVKRIALSDTETAYVVMINE